MTRDEAIQAMKYGCKVTHTTFMDDEFIYMKGHDIWSEDGFNFGGIFAEFWWEKSHNEYFEDGWSVYFKPKDQYETTAVQGDKGYHHFGIHSMTASIYGDKLEDIETLNFKIHDDQSVPEKHMEVADYWGWYDYNEDDFTMMIYPQRFLLDMCFPAGIKGTEDVHHGKAFRLELLKK